MEITTASLAFAFRHHATQQYACAPHTVAFLTHPQGFPRRFEPHRTTRPYPTRRRRRPPLGFSAHNENFGFLESIEGFESVAGDRQTSRRNERSSSTSSTSSKTKTHAATSKRGRNLDASGLVIASSSMASSMTSTTTPSLPPWLEVIEERSTSFSSRTEASKTIRREIEWLEASLLSFRGGNFFSEADVRDVIRAIHWCASTSTTTTTSSSSADRGSGHKVSKIVGSVAFCRLILQLEDDALEAQSGSSGSGNGRNRHKLKTKSSSENKSYLVTKDVLLASILHYSECIDARYDGVYEEMRKAIRGNRILQNSSSSNSDNSNNSRDDLIGIAAHGTASASAIVDDNDKGSHSDSDSGARHGSDGAIVVVHENARDERTSLQLVDNRNANTNTNTNDAFESIFSKESLQLARAATRLKRIEVLASVTLTSTTGRGTGAASGKSRQSQRRPLRNEEYAAVRNLMVSVAEDWRALAIRCAASLFRLEGIVKHSGVSGDFRRRTPEATLAARDSLKVYANLSEQLGLHRLHTQLEARAFRILYPRQYSASSTLFREHGAAMKAISGFLANQLEQLLHEDLSLVFELESLEVASRVKEPYSFWKKLLKTRIRPLLAPATSKNGETGAGIGAGAVAKMERIQRQLVRSTDELSIMEVNDGVALRIILKARKLDADESPESTRNRERMLCYYVHHLVRSQWPETDPKRVKDYIRNPKPNGYQSLHHTSKITRNNQDFFFEVQVRSEEMHRLAEFGVAAHSTYKLNGNSNTPNECSPPSPSSSSQPSPLSPSPPLLSSSAVTDSEAQPSQSSSALVVASKEQVRTKGSDDSMPIRTDARNSGPYINALRKTRQNLVRNHVYVFLAGVSSSTLETGQLLSLSAGSLVVDVLDSLRRANQYFTLDDNEVHVWRNGKIALLDEGIQNGDMIVIERLPLPLPTSSTEVVLNQS